MTKQIDTWITQQINREITHNICNTEIHLIMLILLLNTENVHDLNFLISIAKYM